MIRRLPVSTRPYTPLPYTSLFRALLRWYASSPGAERGFCSRCGSSLAFRSTRWPGELHLAVANLAGPADRAPQAHVFWDMHVDWVVLGDDGLPRKHGRSEEHTSELRH